MRGAVSDDGANHVPRARSVPRVDSRGKGDVDQAIVRRPAADALGFGVLAPLPFGDEHFDGRSFFRFVLLR